MGKTKQWLTADVQGFERAADLVQVSRSQWGSGGVRVVGGGA